MAETFLPSVLVPGLQCTAELFAAQIPALWRFGPVQVADQRRDDSIAGMAERLLAQAPPRFALVALSMGGYVAFEVLRRAPGRVARLALLDTSARPDAPEKSKDRLALIALAEQGGYKRIAPKLTADLIHPSRHQDKALCDIILRMADDTGIEAYVRQQKAIIGRADSRPTLTQIACPTLVLVGDSDGLTPPALAQEMAEGIEGARLAVMPECGHLSTLERPVEVNAALTGLMQG